MQKAETLTGSKKMCQNCYRSLRKGGKQSLSTLNGLTIDQIPKDLNLPDFELHLIAKELLFMKVFKLPKSRMPALKDKVMNVPLTSIDLQTTAQVLPRSLNDSLLVNVQFKRSNDFKNVHSEALMRPRVLLRALTYLQLIGNLFYHEIVLNPTFSFDEAAFINVGEQTKTENDDQEAVQTDTDDCLDIFLIPHIAAAHVISNCGVVVRKKNFRKLQLSFQEWINFRPTGCPMWTLKQNKSLVFSLRRIYNRWYTGGQNLFPAIL